VPAGTAPRTRLPRWRRDQPPPSLLAYGLPESGRGVVVASAFAEPCTDDPAAFLPCPTRPALPPFPAKLFLSPPCSLLFDVRCIELRTCGSLLKVCWQRAVVRVRLGKETPINLHLLLLFLSFSAQNVCDCLPDVSVHGTPTSHCFLHAKRCQFCYLKHNKLVLPLV
jgi:hypothetical protein